MCRCFIESRKVGKDGLSRVENKYYKVTNNLISLEVQIDESTISVMKGKQPVATLNKTADGFNPKQQVTSSTGDPINDAFQRKTAELLNDQQWQAFQKSSNELGADGFQYDEAIGWTAGGTKMGMRQTDERISQKADRLHLIFLRDHLPEELENIMVANMTTREAFDFAFCKEIEQREINRFKQALQAAHFT